MNRSEAGKLGYEKTKDKLKEHREQLIQQLHADYAAHPKFCLTCGEKISFDNRRNKFCDHSCSAKYSNTRRPSISKRSDICICGNIKKRTNKFCAECIEKRVFNKKFSVDQAKTDFLRRHILLEQRGHQCEVCQLAEWQGKPIPIELDHIDGNADNNHENNLRLICPNCHAQTETYKGANVGKNSSRQKKRRNRYAQGLTY